MQHVSDHPDEAYVEAHLLGEPHKAYSIFLCGKFTKLCVNM